MYKRSELGQWAEPWARDRRSTPEARHAAEAGASRSVAGAVSGHGGARPDDIEPSYLLGTVHGVMVVGLGLACCMILILGVWYRSVLAGLAGCMLLIATLITIIEMRRLCRRERLWRTFFQQGRQAGTASAAGAEDLIR